jgi:hypothetical protein
MLHELDFVGRRGAAAYHLNVLLRGRLGRKTRYAADRAEPP